MSLGRKTNLLFSSKRCVTIAALAVLLEMASMTAVLSHWNNITSDTSGGCNQCGCPVAGDWLIA